MSTFVYNENIKNTMKILNFCDFIISEAIEPISINFGTDFENKEWYSDGVWKFTFFKYKDSSVDDLYKKANLFPGERPYVVIFDSTKSIPDIGFATGDYTPKNIEKLKSKEIVTDYFDFGLRKQGNALKVINFFFYIALNGMKKFDFKEVSFKGANKELVQTYSKIMNNKFFIEKLKKLGYEFYKSENDVHFLRKI